MAITSIDDYRRFWRENYAMAFTAGAHILMRGHGRPEYENLPTLARYDLSNEQCLEFERRLFDEFEQLVADTNEFGGVRLKPLIPGKATLNTWFRLTQMRHLEFPSRLMDWTMKKEIALYFAVCNEDHHDVDGHVWFTFSPTGWGTMRGDQAFIQEIERNYQHLNAGRESMDILDTIDPWNPERTLLIHYAHSGADWTAQTAEVRRGAQGGKFIICPNDRFRIPLDQHLIGRYAQRVIVPAESKAGILQELTDINYSTLTVLPTLSERANILRQEIIEKVLGQLTS